MWCATAEAGCLTAPMPDIGFVAGPPAALREAHVRGVGYPVFCFTKLSSSSRVVYQNCGHCVWYRDAIFGPSGDMYKYFTPAFSRPLPRLRLVMSRPRRRDDSCYCSSSFFSSFLLASLTLLSTLPPSSLSPFHPSTCPISPPGFGTGHSLFGFNLSSSAFFRKRSSLITSLHVSSSGGVLRLRRRRGSGPSASVRGSTGQGMRCGAATTRKETMRVVVKREVVMRERGWRCGGILVWCGVIEDVAGASPVLDGCEQWSAA